MPKRLLHITIHRWKDRVFVRTQMEEFFECLKRVSPNTCAQRRWGENLLHMHIGTFCYTKMPFKLKNAWVIYQRLACKVFEPQLGRKNEVYVDDRVIKSQDNDHFLQEIFENFTNLRAINMKLYPKKCLFGIEEGKLLGHVITKEAIRANPKKIESFI